MSEKIRYRFVNSELQFRHVISDWKLLIPDYSRSLDSDGSTSCNSKLLYILRPTASLVEEIHLYLLNSLMYSSSLIEPERETARLPELLPVTLYIDDMPTSASLYNGELGTPQV